MTITLLAGDVYGGNDNLIYQPPTFNYVVDRAGFGFTDGTNNYNIFVNVQGAIPPDYHECSSAVESGCTGLQADDAQSLTSLTITPGTSSAVPEPANIGWAGILVLGTVALIRRKYRVS